jgi:hypothetical protein
MADSGETITETTPEATPRDETADRGDATLVYRAPAAEIRSSARLVFADKRTEKVFAPISR